MNLNVKKSSSSKAIPAKILKRSVHIYLPFLTICINHSFVANKFPDELKQSEVIPLCKKLDPLKKENYRPVSFLPHVSKVFERIIYKQIMSCHKFAFRLYYRISKIIWKSALSC